MLMDYKGYPSRISAIKEIYLYQYQLHPVGQVWREGAGRCQKSNNLKEEEVG